MDPTGSYLVPSVMEFGDRCLRLRAILLGRLTGWLFCHGSCTHGRGCQKRYGVALLVVSSDRLATLEGEKHKNFQERSCKSESSRLSLMRLISGVLWASGCFVGCFHCHRLVPRYRLCVCKLSSPAVN